MRFAPAEDFLVVRLVDRHDAFVAETLRARVRRARVGDARGAALDRSAARTADARHAVEIVRARAGSRSRRASITSGRPPTRDATTGTSHAIASSAARPKLSCADGSRNTSDDRQQRQHLILLAEELHLVGDAERRAPAASPRPGPGRRRPSAAGPAPRGRSRANTSIDRRHPLHRPEVRDVDDDLLAVAARSGARSAGTSRRRCTRAVEEVRNHADVARRRRARDTCPPSGSPTPPSRRRTARCRTRRSPSTSGSLPSSVMSVPCSVVMTLRGTVHRCVAARICRARYAAVACGIA